MLIKDILSTSSRPTEGQSEKILDFTLVNLHKLYILYSQYIAVFDISSLIQARYEQAPLFEELIPLPEKGTRLESTILKDGSVHLFV